MKTKKRDDEPPKNILEKDYILLENKYLLLEEKYNQSVESYNVLLHQLKQLQRAQFGTKSERFTDLFDGQQALFESKELDDIFDSDQDDDDDDPDPGPNGGIPVQEHTRNPKTSIANHDHLPTREEVIPVEESERQCACGCQKTRVGFEIKWMLHYVPAVFERILQKREKVSCPRCKDQITTSALSPHILPKAGASEELLAHIVITKLIDRQPLYHMEKYWLERFKVKIRRQTLARWMIESAKKLMPLVNLLKEEIMSYHLSTIDATKIQVLKEEGRKATTASSMYCIRGGPPDKRSILLEYNAQKHKQFVDDLYAEYRGLIQSDAEVIFVKLGDKEGITVSLCNAHARRKFEPIAKASKTNGTAYQAMRYFRKLYKIEANAKRLGLTADQRYELRQKESKPIVMEFHQFLLHSKLCVLPQSTLGKAIAYSLTHWEGLTRFLDHGELEIDNNATEREIKVLVMARKNFLFSYSVEGAEALGIYFSVIQSARVHGLEPESYLTAVFKAIPLCKTYEDYAALLPWNYAKKLSEAESLGNVA